MNKSTRKNIISGIITVLILLVGVLIFNMLSNQKESTVSTVIEKKERRKVVLSSYQPQSLTNKIDVDGRIMAHQRVNITSKVQGLLLPAQRSVKEGRRFAKGDLLFSVDQKEAAFNLKAQKSNLLSSITQIMPDLKFDYPSAFSNWDDYLSKYSIDQSISELPKPTSEKEKYFIAGRNIYSQYYNIKSIETRLKDYNIYAPFTGAVTQVNVFPGALVNPNQALATMINTGLYEMSAPIPLSALPSIKVGQSVTLSSSDLDKKWNGKVSRIGSQIDQATQNLPLYITVSGSGLRDGMYLEGSLNGSSLSDVISLPKEIFVTSDAIYTVVDSTIILKKLDVIKRNKEDVIIKNLSAKDQVISGSLTSLFEGQKVTY